MSNQKSVTSNQNKNTKKIFLATRYLLLVTLMGLILPQAMSLAATYYVAPEGNDQWSGTFPQANNASTNGPFKTIEKARDTIRQLKKEGKFNEPVNVFLREGTYFLDKTFEITGEDSGTSACPITYQAYSGEKVTISGGTIINNTWESYKGNIYVTNIGNLRFNSLFVNDRRATRAREPDEDYYIIESVDPETNWEAFNFSNNDIDGSWYNLNDVEVVSLRGFEQSRLRIDRVEGNKVYFQGTPRHAYDWLFWWGSYGTRRYYVENVFEGLDEPGEWYLDNQTGDLYYWPLPGETIEDLEIIAPVLDQILKMQGFDKVNSVENINLKGIIFAHTDWFLPEEGYKGDQSAWRLENLPTIDFIFTNNCVFRNNTIIHVGAYALRSYSENLQIIGNGITDIGAGGIKLGVWDDHWTPDSNYYGVTKNNIITDNKIYDIGKVYKEGAGIFAMISGNNTISHNLIYNTPSIGIAVGWGWSDEDTACKNNLIEYNEIYDVMRQLLDGAGIYVMGKQPGTTIRNNKIHDIPPYRDAAAVYIDEGGRDISIKNNWFYRTERGLILHRCADNLVENNVFVSQFWTIFNYGGGIYIDETTQEGDNKVTKNIIYSIKMPELFKTNASFLNVGYSDYNLYYNVPRWNQENWDNQLKEWRTNTGFDMNSLEEDPLFVDYDNDDFNLLLNSPAFSIGFEQIDMANVGPRLQDEATPPKGDLNLDGRVNAQDVQCCVNHISGKQDWGSDADVNKDGKVDESDVEEIIDIILGE